MLYFASDRLKDDKEVVLAAVTKYTDTIKFASPQIQALCQGQNPIEAITQSIKLKNFTMN